MKSDWNPPKAGKEIEKFISRLQEKFDKWKPKRFVSDNLSKSEREFLKTVRSNQNIVYMWEDKGPSFVKMTKEQYLQAGEVELGNRRFYQEIHNDASKEIKEKNDVIVDSMIGKDEIPLKVGGYLKDGELKVPRFYHLLKTHKIPTEIDDPEEWLENNGFPLRGIISGNGAPTERLAGFVDLFLQPGMEGLD